jgi:hypothetical protein
MPNGIQGRGMPLIPRTRSPGATRPGQPISVSSAGALAPMRDRRAKPPPYGNVKVSKAVLLEASNHEA